MGLYHCATTLLAGYYISAGTCSSGQVKAGSGQSSRWRIWTSVVMNEPQTIDEWNIAIARDPGNADYYRGRGTLHGQLGQPHHALADFSTAIQLNPIDAESHYRRALVHALMGDRPAATADLQEVLRLDPGHTEAHYQLGLLGGNFAQPPQNPKQSWRWPSGWRLMLYLLIAVAVAAIVVNLLSDAPNEEPVPEPDPDMPPNLRHIEEKRHMLELINEERVAEGLIPVVLGTNVAAQLHAESSIEECFSSHWNLDGLKPYMRYSRQGGYQANTENVSGSDFCPSGLHTYAQITDIRERIRRIMKRWMDSPGHREAILDPWAIKVNLGLAWSRYNISAVQQFEAGHVEYARLPEIEKGVLTVAGSLKNGMSFTDDDDLVVGILYDHPPEELTRGQLARTGCYDSGIPVANLRRPPPTGAYYELTEADVSIAYCPDPRQVPRDAPPPESSDEAHELWEKARDAVESQPERVVTKVFIEASRWHIRKEAFSVRADISALMSQYGPGVYTVAIATTYKGEPLILSLYSIFHETRSPT